MEAEKHKISGNPHKSIFSNIFPLSDRSDDLSWLQLSWYSAPYTRLSNVRSSVCLFFSMAHKKDQGEFGNVDWNFSVGRDKLHLWREGAPNTVKAAVTAQHLIRAVWKCIPCIQCSCEGESKCQQQIPQKDAAYRSSFLNRFFFVINLTDFFFISWIYVSRSVSVTVQRHRCLRCLSMLSAVSI